MALIRNKVETILPSAVYAADQSKVLRNRDYRGLILFWDITDVPTIDTVLLEVRFSDPLSGNVSADDLVDPAPKVATGQFWYIVGATAEESAMPGVDKVTRLLPFELEIFINHSALTDFTYSVVGQWLV